MLNTISWQAYWTAIAFVFAGYYAVVVMLYYTVDLKRALLSSRARAPASPSDPVAETDIRFPSGPADRCTPPFPAPACGNDDPSDSIQPFLDELQAFFEQAGASRLVKGELLFSLGRIIRKYPSLKGAPSQSSIEHVIVQDCEKHCSIHLDAGDLSTLWIW